MPIINSHLDTDLYKITMLGGVLHHYPDAMVKYEFKCRDEGIDLKPIMPAVEAQINDLCNLRYKAEELSYIDSLGFIKSDVTQFLRLFHYNRDYIRVDKEKAAIEIEGPWLHTIPFETPVLAIVSELWANYNANGSIDFAEAQKRLDEKLALLYHLDLLVADFGTRRRRSFKWHHDLIEYLIRKVPGNFVGTSNMFLAKRFGVKAIGTMAHEWLQAHQQLGVRVADSQKAALDCWAREYRGQLGIALTDVIGIDAFLDDFDLYFAKLFDGVRHDSGDPYIFGQKVIKHYEKLGIDPKTKTIVFSDGLTFQRMVDLYKEFYKYIKVSFGIGTNLTNDFPFPALNIVLKMVECNGNPVAKISDSPGKNMCKDEAYIKYLIEVYRRKIAGRI